MAFPTVASITPSTATSNATSLSVANPGSGIASGDLLLHIISNDGSGDTMSYPAGDLTDNVLVAANSGSFGHYITYQIADGTENGGSNTSTVSTGAETIDAAVLLIQGWHGTTPPEHGRAQTSGTSVDPPSLNPAGWDDEDTLWIAAMCSDDEAGQSLDVHSYADNQTSVSGNVMLSLSTDELTGSSQDPGAMTIGVGTEQIAFTIAIRPSAGGGATASLILLSDHFNGGMI